MRHFVPLLTAYHQPKRVQSDSSVDDKVEVDSLNDAYDKYYDPSEHLAIAPHVERNVV
jgi:hypothetical protein